MLADKDSTIMTEIEKRQFREQEYEEHEMME